MPATNHTLAAGRSQSHDYHCSVNFISKYSLGSQPSLTFKKCFVTNIMATLTLLKMNWKSVAKAKLNVMYPERLNIIVELLCVPGWDVILINIWIRVYAIEHAHMQSPHNRHSLVSMHLFEKQHWTLLPKQPTDFYTLNTLHHGRLYGKYVYFHVSSFCLNS